MASLPDDSPLLELIPVSQLKPHQVTKYKNGEVWPTYKFRRTPRSVNDFGKYASMFSIWQENETRILIGPAHVYYHGKSMVTFYNASANVLWRYVALTDNDRCLVIFFQDWNCTIIGKSDQGIAETAAFLCGLKEKWRYGEVRGRFDYSGASWEQLVTLLRTCPHMPVTLDVTNISIAQSRLLAEFPDQIDLTLDLNAFADDGEAFVNSLLRRDSWFGTLTLYEKDYTNNENFDLLLQARALNKLVIPRIKPRQIRPQQIRQILSALAYETSFQIIVQDALDLDWSNVTMVPKKLCLSFRVNFDSAVQVLFVRSFFHRLAQLGDFDKLDLDLCCGSRSSMPRSVMNMLLEAVIANRGLREVALQHSYFQITPYLNELFAMAERHEGLIYLRIASYPAETDPHYTMLKTLLNRNRTIQVIDNCGNRITNGDEIDRLYAFNRFFQDFQNFPMESLSVLPPLLGEALTQRPGNDFRWSALLMANHTDALCQLMQHSSLFNLDAHTPKGPKELAGTKNAPVPKRPNESVPLYPRKRNT